MTIGEFLNLPAGVLTAVATLLAALIAALTVILSAAINARTARTVARDSFRRQMAYDKLKPFLDRLDAQTILLHEAVDVGRVLVKELGEGLGKVLQETGPERAVLAKELQERLAALMAKMKDNVDENRRVLAMWREGSMWSVLARDQQVVDAATVWIGSCGDFFVLASENRFGIKGPILVNEMATAAQDVLHKGIRLRLLLEDSVLQPPGWWSRTLYAATRWTRKLRGRDAWR
jgi:hypothetical protein